MEVTRHKDTRTARGHIRRANVQGPCRRVIPVTRWPFLVLSAAEEEILAEIAGEHNCWLCLTGEAFEGAGDYPALVSIVGTANLVDELRSYIFLGSVRLPAGMDALSSPIEVC